MGRWIDPSVEDPPSVEDLSVGEGGIVVGSTVQHKYAILILYKASCLGRDVPNTYLCKAVHYCIHSPDPHLPALSSVHWLLGIQPYVIDWSGRFSCLYKYEILLFPTCKAPFSLPNITGCVPLLPASVAVVNTHLYSKKYNTKLNGP